MAEELAKQFEALWESGDSSPDVFAFLEQQNGAAADDVFSVLLQDQQRRWKTKNPLKVEDYLAKLPELANDHDIKVQLAVGEFQARQNGEASPSVDEFASRFPDIGETLRSELTEVASANPSGCQTQQHPDRRSDRHALRCRLRTSHH